MQSAKPEKGDVLVPEGKLFPDGALVVDGYDETGLLLIAHPLGGGFQHQIPECDMPKFRLVDSVEQSRGLSHRIRVVLADSEYAFDAWTDGRLWNGWEMPRFEREEADLLVKWLGTSRARYDQLRDAYITISQDGDEEVWEAEAVFVSDGSSMKVYPIGAGAWIWEEVQPAERKEAE